MKNVQMIDGADNCTFSIFQVTAEEFKIIFPKEGQDIEFREDLFERIGANTHIMEPIWDRPIRKQDAAGIHGTLFWNFEKKKESFPKSKCHKDWGSALNDKERQIYNLSHESSS